MQTKVSMIVPCYNKGEYIGAMLESVYNQIWDNIELILVYDASPDNTRDVILSWLPKLEARGYSVVFLERTENTGLSLAVRDGLQLMTGEYFCTVDCDDELAPEYVSEMATWLDGHPENDLVSCDVLKLRRIAGVPDTGITIEYLAPPDSPTMLEEYIFLRCCGGVWLHLIRTDYAKRCGLTESFPTENTCSQEPPFIIPLAAGRGHMKYIDKQLYKYFVRYTGLYTLRYSDNNPTFVRDYIQLCRLTINHLKNSDEQKQRLLSICDLAEPKWEFYLNADFIKRPELREPTAQKAADAVNRLLSPSPSVTSEQILAAGYRSFYIAVENCVLKLTNRYLPAVWTPPENSRVIGYGVLGSVGSEFLTPLMNSPLRPTELWDAAAKPGDIRGGMPVQKPDFSELKPGDVLLIIPRNRHVKEDVQATVKDIAGVQCIYHFDILEYLAAHYFPEIQQDCEFIG